MGLLVYAPLLIYLTPSQALFTNLGSSPLGGLTTQLSYYRLPTNLPHLRPLHQVLLQNGFKASMNIRIYKIDLVL